MTITTPLGRQTVHLNQPIDPYPHFAEFRFAKFWWKENTKGAMAALGLDASHISPVRIKFHNVTQGKTICSEGDTTDLESAVREQLKPDLLLHIHEVEWAQIDHCDVVR